MEDLISIVRELVSAHSEEEWFEFKENWYEPAGLGEYISALSNSAATLGKEQSYLIWGVSDMTHELIGTDFDYHRDVKNEPLEHYLARQIVPDIAFEFREIEVDNKRLVVLIIPAAKQVPIAFNGTRFIRIGSSKANLAKYPERESKLFDILRNGFPTIENMEAFENELTFRKLFLYYEDKGIHLSQDTFKKNLGLLTKSGEYNLMAQLLSDNSQIPVRVSIFKGRDKTSSLFAVREFGNNCILLTLDKVLEFGDVLNVMQADEKDRLVERKEVPLFDQNAFREAVVNAFVHNLWIDGNAPMITVYNDRIEILSRGTLPPRQTLNGFYMGESVPVNRRLSDIFLQLHISERSGRGVPQITKVYGKDAFDFRENSIVVTIPFSYLPTEVGNKVGKKVGDKVGDNTNIKLNPTRQRIVEEMRNNPNITQKQLATMIGISVTAIQNNIRFLRDNKIIDRIGSNKNGWWQVF
ncbi:MAG: putative DNA binding domain-containing protein [Prevotella sp.]|nr:putative DNA binding domain-containing protein [Prevotella sp.]